MTTLAGTAGMFGSADGTGAAARFDHPAGVAVDSAGNVYVADQFNYSIRKVTADGVVTTLASLVELPGSPDGTVPVQPAGVAVGSVGNVYVADQSNDTILKITAAGVVTTLAGTAGMFGSADGTGAAAQFNHPAGVAVDSAGNVYVADQMNRTIRKVTTAGVVTTLAAPLACPAVRMAWAPPHGSPYLPAWRSIAPATSTSPTPTAARTARAPPRASTCLAMWQSTAPATSMSPISSTAPSARSPLTDS